jgi:2-polyprenyl-3-methyl-5-hydroxy-6-metoxy-1,4-benzoquinol methylase
MPGSAQGFPDAVELAHDRGADLDLYQCGACGLVQLPGTPVSYYREVIRAAAYSDEMRTFRERQFADWAARHGLAGRKVLEVGCGCGEYLMLLRAAGMDADGLEAGAAVRHCRGQRLPAQRGYLTRRSQALAGAPYAAFVILNFLEHWPDPVGSLAAAVRNLEDGGVGLVEVPNFDMIVRQALFSEFIADHLLYFTEETLRFTLQRSGLEVLSCRSVWHDYILSAEVRKRAPLDVGPLEHRRAEIVAALRGYIARFPAGQVAVWGAGHQALCVIALADIAKGLRYIVDSAPFKQGRFSPASHLRIVAPDTLVDEPVQAVIVMAASYSDEVAGLLRRRFDPALAVAVLRDDGLEEA